MGYENYFYFPEGYNSKVKAKGYSITKGGYEDHVLLRFRLQFTINGIIYTSAEKEKVRMILKNYSPDTENYYAISHKLL